MNKLFPVICCCFLPSLLLAQEVISEFRLRKHVSALAHDSMKGRFTLRNEIRLAANYIAGQMDSIGLKRIAGEEDGFLISWSPKTNNRKKNRYVGDHVVGIIPGASNKEKLIIISAHYDHIGTTLSQKAMPFGTVKKYIKGDSIYNGANDNATGVAAMLELARLFSQVRPSYTLMFVAFSGEELGLLGSSDFAKDVLPSSVKMNVNLEMLGRPDGRKPFILEDEGQSYILRRLNKTLFSSTDGYPKEYFVVDPYPEQRLFTRSDNYSFHKRGIQAFTIMATDPEDEFYHSANDEVDTIQFDQMQVIVQAIFRALLPIVMDEE